MTSLASLASQEAIVREQMIDAACFGPDHSDDGVSDLTPDDTALTKLPESRAVIQWDLRKGDDLHRGAARCRVECIPGPMHRSLPRSGRTHDTAIGLDPGSPARTPRRGSQ